METINFDNDDQRNEMLDKDEIIATENAFMPGETGNKGY